MEVLFPKRTTPESKQMRYVYLVTVIVALVVIPVLPGLSGDGDALLIVDTSQETARSCATEQDRVLTNEATLATGDWSGNWDGTNITMPNDGLFLFGFSSLNAGNGVDRAGAVSQFSLDTGIGFSNVGILGAGNRGYLRDNTPTFYSTDTVRYLGYLSTDDEVKLRTGTLLNTSDRSGSINHDAGDSRGMWAVDFGQTRDYLIATISSADVGSGRAGNAQPVDLGTPTALSEGTWKSITWDTTEDSSGTTITRSGSNFTVTANSKVLLNVMAQGDNSTFGDGGDRMAMLLRVDVDGSPYCYATDYDRGPNLDGNNGCAQLIVPIVTGGSSVDVTMWFVVHSSISGFDFNCQDACASFVDISDNDVVILGKTDADVGIDSSTITDISWPVADEIQVDTSFSHPVGNLTRIENNAAAQFYILTGFTITSDRDATGARIYPCASLSKNGVDCDSCVSGAYSRGDDNSVNGSVELASMSHATVMQLGSSDYVECGVFNPDNVSDDSMINFTDGAAGYFWAVRLDADAVTPSDTRPPWIRFLTIPDGRDANIVGGRESWSLF